MIDYRDPQGKPYVVPRKQVWTALPVCEYLVGSPWDDVALAAVSTLRPSYIRVITPELDYLTDDGMTWRATVKLDNHGLIKSVEQEVIAGVPEDVQHGHDLCTRLRTHPNWPK